ncbi:MAG: NAD(P)/FAD-dependent oxidoreductase [Cenarchaeum sp. SB0663_bin_5]|nr:NAD(P)/FAD-dependent oxidoreductase [Cenarchaeum sp. SB0663_bin_5]MYH04846.1 NAD(P)/FAD-dependent oxidoreductase [Cenarchaeum sp. SB0675_bin_21]
MYDAIVVGAGPGGYACAISLAKGGANVCIIERNGLGGTCTQRGCIPTKYLHAMGDLARRVRASKRHGIGDGTISINYDMLSAGMKSTISRIASGMRLQLRQHNVDTISGEASVISPGIVEVDGARYETRNVVLATGSMPKTIDLPGYETLTTDSVFELQSLPESILVIGGGYSGCEFASILNALGCRVWLAEAQGSLLPGQPKIVGDTVEKYMKLDGISVFTGATANVHDGRIVVGREEMDPEVVLASVGRYPALDADRLDMLGVKYGDSGIVVDARMQTSADSIYAVGDVTGVYELAHVATRQGEVAADNILGRHTRIDYTTIPYCVFTYPEVAMVGRLDGSAATVQMVANAKANCMGQTRGFASVYTGDGTLQGALIVGAHASEIIGEAALAIRLGLRPQDVVNTIHAHPTLPEALADAAAAAARMQEAKKACPGPE